jgi:hypothetical protein
MNQLAYLLFSLPCLQISSFPSASAGVILPSVITLASGDGPLSPALLAAREAASLVFSWRWLSVPINSQVSDGLLVPVPGGGSDTSSSSSRTFVPDVVGSYIAGVTVSDGCAAVTTEAVAVVGPRLPWVYAGGARSLILTGNRSRDTLPLSGAQFVAASGKLLYSSSATLSADTAAAGVVFLWTVVSKPPGSQVVLSNPTSLFSTFSGSVFGTFTLRVSLTSRSFDWTLFLPR